MPQDPEKKKQEPQPSMFGSNEERAATLDAVLNALQKNQKMRHAEDLHEQKLQQAMEAHAQELRQSGIEHAVSMRHEAMANQLQNEKTAVDLEIKKVEAAKDGTYVPVQDPAQPIQPPRYQNQTLENAIATIRNRALDKQSLLSQDATKEFVKQLDSTTKEALEQKSLRFAPAGIFGQLLGQALNIIPGLELGTMIFGGRMPAAARAQLLASNLYKTSPLVRTELNNMISEDKIDIANAKLRYPTMPKTASISQGNAIMSEAIGTTRLEIDSLLGNDPELSTFFSSEGLLKRSLNAFETTNEFSKKAEDAFDDTQAIAHAQKAVESEIQSSAFADEYFNNGGTPEQLLEIVKKAQARIDKEYPLTKLDPSIPYSREQLGLIHAQRSTANEYGNMMTEWAREMSKRAGFNPLIQRKTEQKRVKDLIEQTIKEEFSDEQIDRYAKMSSELGFDVAAGTIEQAASKFPKEMQAGVRERFKELFEKRRQSRLLRSMLQK